MAILVSWEFDREAIIGTIVGSGISLQYPTATILISLIQKALEWQMSSSTSLSALEHSGLRETHTSYQGLS